MDVSTEIVSIVQVAGMIALVCTSLTTVVVVMYFAGSSLAYPFGQTILGFYQRTISPTSNTQWDDRRTPSQPSQIPHDKAARHPGALITLLLFIVTLMTELVLEEQRDITGKADCWDIRRASVVLTRACAEVLLVLAFLRGIRYIGRKLLRL